MPASTTVQLGTASITVRELLVREVRDWLAEVEAGTVVVDAVSEFAFEDCSLADLARVCGVPVGAFDQYAPSELEALKEAARALNPHFFRVRAAIAAAQVAHLRALLPPATSSAPRSPS